MSADRHTGAVSGMAMQGPAKGNAGERLWLLRPTVGEMRTRMASLLTRRSPVLSMADQVLASGGNFATSVLIARILGLEAFGWYALIWIAILFAMALQLGAVVSPMMSIGNKLTERQARRYLSVVVLHEAAFCLATMAFIALVCAVLIAPGAGLSAGTVALAAAAGGAYVAQDFARRLMFTRGRPHLALLIDIVHQGLRNGALLILLIFGTRLGLDADLGTDLDTGLDTILAILGAAALVSVLLAVPFAGPFHFRRHAIGSVTARQWRSGRWLSASGLLMWLATNSSLIVTGAVLGPVAVAGLRTAMTVVGALNVLREGLENILPQLTARRYASGGEAALKRTVVLVSIAVFGVGAMLSAVLMMYGEAALRVIYGAEFAAYGYVLSWLSLTFPLALLNLTMGCAFRALERTSMLFAGVGTAAAVSLVAIYPAVALFGVPGAVAVIVLAELAITLVFLVKIRGALFVARPGPAA